MSSEHTQRAGGKDAGHAHLKQQSAVPGKGGIGRVAASFVNTVNGLREGILTEAAIKQEAAIALVALPLSFFIAETIWVWVALIASLCFVFAIEFLNTAIERLCNHLHPDVHEAIKVTKDLASAGVFFGLLLAGVVWGVALLQVTGVI